MSEEPKKKSNVPTHLTLTEKGRKWAEIIEALNPAIKKALEKMKEAQK